MLYLIHNLRGGIKMTFAVVSLLFIGATLIGVAKFLNWLEEGGY